MFVIEIELAVVIEYRYRLSTFKKECIDEVEFENDITSPVKFVSSVLLSIF